ncbi:MAG: hypothetical protein LUG24_08060 [Clostridiales bacterium]|nr:hypothetical protein [Clostridiales bacterium]
MKRKVLSILCCASLVLNSGTVFASDVAESSNAAYVGEVQFAPINPEFEEYMNKQNESDLNAISDDSDDVNYGVIPDLYEIPYIPSETSKAKTAATSNLPTSYNTGSTKEYISPVKNQYSRGLCWDFASIGNLESTLLYNMLRDINCQV